MGKRWGAKVEEEFGTDVLVLDIELPVALGVHDVDGKDQAQRQDGVEAGEPEEDGEGREARCWAWIAPEYALSPRGLEGYAQPQHEPYSLQLESGLEGWRMRQGSG